MPFQVVYTNTFAQANPPSIEEFLAETDPSVLANYPEAAGKTPLEVYHETVDSAPERQGPAVGFLSETITTDPNGLSSTLTQTWDSQASYLATQPVVTPTEGNISSNAMPTAYAQVTFLYRQQYLTNVSITFGNI